jgi:hypothetical protein
MPDQQKDHADDTKGTNCQNYPVPAGKSYDQSNDRENKGGKDHQ